MHCHVKRNGVILSWAWTTESMLEAKGMAKRANTATLGRPGDAYMAVECQDDPCELYDEWKRGVS